MQEGNLVHIGALGGVVPSSKDVLETKCIMPYSCQDHESNPELMGEGITAIPPAPLITCQVRLISLNITTVC